MDCADAIHMKYWYA